MPYWTEQYSDGSPLSRVRSEVWRLVLVTTGARIVSSTHDRWCDLCDPAVEYVDEFRCLGGFFASEDGARECRLWCEVLAPVLGASSFQSDLQVRVELIVEDPPVAGSRGGVHEVLECFAQGGEYCPPESAVEQHEFDALFEQVDAADHGPPGGRRLRVAQASHSPSGARVEGCGRRRNPLRTRTPRRGAVGRMLCSRCPPRCGANRRATRGRSNLRQGYARYRELPSVLTGEQRGADGHVCSRPVAPDLGCDCSSWAGIPRVI